MCRQDVRFACQRECASNFRFEPASQGRTETFGILSYAVSPEEQNSEPSAGVVFDGLFTKLLFLRFEHWALRAKR
jgi:hypothetical protein